MTRLQVEFYAIPSWGFARFCEMKIVEEAKGKLPSLLLFCLLFCFPSALLHHSLVAKEQTQGIFLLGTHKTFLFYFSTLVDFSVLKAAFCYY